MTEVFEAKLRRIGNSFGIIVPREVIDGLGVHQGDPINVCIPSSDVRTRNRKLRKLVGIYRKTSRFKREKDDRF